MKNMLFVAITTLFFLSCTKQTPPVPTEENTHKTLLSKKAWQLSDLNWVVNDNGQTIVRYTMDSLPECTKMDPYKFNKFIMAVPYGTERSGCDSIPAQSGKFELSEDGKTLKFSMFVQYVDSLMVYDVIELSETRFEIRTRNGALENRNNEVEMIFVRKNN